MKISIDVVIPTFRLNEAYLLPLLQLKRPANANITFYLLADNPAVEPSPQLLAYIDNTNAFLLINNENIGASKTRNRGISAGSGNWILFLDDDIQAPPNLLEIYTDAATNAPGEIGFIGTVLLPPARTAFSNAIQVSGSMDIFTIAQKKESHAWGATANMMVKRSAIGAIRFSEKYPKAGGGEDVDFFMNVRQQNNFKNFRTLPQAVVQHPWWHNETPDFTRPFRYGKGNSLLGQLNPLYTYRDFFNTAETLFIALLCLIAALAWRAIWVKPILSFMAGALVIEFIAITIQALKRSRSTRLLAIYYLFMLRFVYECGLLYGNLSRMRLIGIGQRFHDGGLIRKIYFYRTNTIKLVKWILYPLLFALCFSLL